MEAALGRGQFLARIGGDEFVVVFDADTGPADAEGRCRRMFDALRADLHIAKRRNAISMSVGLDHFLGGMDSYMDAFVRADAALNLAGDQSRDQIRELAAA